MVEGINPRPTSRHDSAYDLVGISHHISCGEAERRNALRHYPGVPLQISLGPIPHFMGRAVYLYRKARFAAEEVEDITAGRMLAPELETAWPVPKARP